MRYIKLPRVYDNQSEHDLSQEDLKKQRELATIVEQWRSHKAKATAVACKMLEGNYGGERLFGRGQRMFECGDDVTIKWYKDERRIEAKRCRDKLCPLCAWRLSMQRQRVLSTGLKAAIENDAEPTQFAFITLTVRNCKNSTLRPTIDWMNAAWREMTRRNPWKKTYCGYYRTLEVTYNEEQDTYHPHFHTIAELKKGAGVNLEEIRAAWKSALAIDYNPICEAHRIEPRGKNDLTDAVVEVSRYALSPAMLESADIEVLHTLAEHLANVKVVTAGGSLRKYTKRPELPTPSSRMIARTNLFWDEAKEEYIATHRNA